jgi:2-amino-4-hydroxy-6-hydroxymethyldihydropteridine diphosphokinase
VVKSSDKRKNEVFISLGANQGDPRRQLPQAIELITEQLGELLKQSAIYRSEPWGNAELDWFYNQVISVDTALSPEEVLSQLQHIEKKLGRKKPAISGHYEARPIDLDILSYEDRLVNTTNLTIPHPLLHERKFVLIPLVEIAAEWQHPVLGAKASEMLLNCMDLNKVEKCL